jgi:hypothetical protein
LSAGERELAYEALALTRALLARRRSRTNGRAASKWIWMGVAAAVQSLD